ncbi:zf-C2H2 Zinc finger, C2H2 type [Scheffersomyces stipitis CBS 6054]|uniref:Zf-C2H2 Zinc finger, C2H2 type n=1 Tax=Scheffersomyces stipitis (strain ATCC 58785 / CBS 6054 / NBRC 10063 / NRRL Y-11545) TaxID=322104 RepID=A3GFQ2_PICST|nr:zf-C2H2 Zinc finger, C2H2 type [Scheffersomyces stipitis CBS 6054]EAZ63389.2 zf-C2H2 Zinc finger, C2H2 type [Scheffersomyces stipitis CBS 6054]
MFSTDYSHGLDLTFDLYSMPPASAATASSTNNTNSAAITNASAASNAGGLTLNNFHSIYSQDTNDFLYQSDISNGTTLNGSNDNFMSNNSASITMPVSSSTSLSSFSTTSTTPSESRASISSADSVYYNTSKNQSNLSMFAQPYPFGMSTAPGPSVAAAAAIAAAAASATQQPNVATNYNNLIYTNGVTGTTNNLNVNSNINSNNGTNSNGTLSTPPTSPAPVPSYMAGIDTSALANTYQFDFDDVPQDALFNTDALFDNNTNHNHHYNSNGASVPTNYQYKTVPNTPISEGDLEGSPMIMMPSGVLGSAANKLVLESQNFAGKRRRNTEPMATGLAASSSSSHMGANSTSLDVKTAIELATRAFSKSSTTSLHHSDVSHHHHLPLEYKYNQPVKEQLLRRFSASTIREIKLTESDLFCKNHCNSKFPNYLAMIDHFDKHRLNLVDYRSFKCPVAECPMHILGYEKKADLRHHVVIDHFKKGKVLDQFEMYSSQLQAIIYVCTQDNCGKGFYRRDSLTRHIKLVHQNQASLFNQKRRQSEVGTIDEDEEDAQLKSKKKKRRKKN